MNQLTFFAEELPVNHSAWLDFGQDSATQEETSCLHTLQLLINIAPNGSFGRMSKGFCRLTEEGILECSSAGWQQSGMGSPTGFLTLETSTHQRQDDSAYLLSQIVSHGNEQQKRYLSLKALNGLIRRNGAKDIVYRCSRLARGGVSLERLSQCFIEDNGRIRYLTSNEALECMGFPRDYLDGIDGSESARIKAIGNSWAVPVVRWIGERINNQQGHTNE